MGKNWDGMGMIWLELARLTSTKVISNESCIASMLQIGTNCDVRRKEEMG